MAKRIGVSKSEMLRMREEGLSNRDIAKCLDIHVATVYSHIGPQGGRMDNLAAFDDPKPTKVEMPKAEAKSVPRAVDQLVTVRETLMSADSNFEAELDYGLDECSMCLFGETSKLYIPFDKLPELVTFIIGLASRAEEKKI